MRTFRAVVLTALLSPALAKAQVPQQMPGITVTAPAAGPEVPPVSPVIERYSPPNTIVSTDKRRIDDTVNIVDTEDAVKYFPSLLVRKRYIADYNHAILSSRASGTGNSARSAVYADGMLLSNYLGNGVGGLSFYDAVGLRFHLPAYLSLAVIDFDRERAGNVDDPVAHPHVGTK